MKNFKEFLICDGDKELTDESVNPSLYLDPLSQKKWRPANKFDQLKIILNQEKKQGNKASDLWVHFSNIAKLGIYPNAIDGSTPIGIYAYPIEEVLKKRDELPYGVDRNFIIVFKIVDKTGFVKIPNLGKRDEKQRLKIIHKNKEKFDFNQITEIKNQIIKMFELNRNRIEKIFYSWLETVPIDNLKNKFADIVNSFNLKSIEREFISYSKDNELNDVNHIISAIYRLFKFKINNMKDKLMYLFNHYIEIKRNTIFSYIESKMSKNESGPVFYKYMVIDKYNFRFQYRPEYLRYLEKQDGEIEGDLEFDLDNLPKNEEDFQKDYFKKLIEDYEALREYLPAFERTLSIFKIKINNFIEKKLMEVANIIGSNVPFKDQLIKLCQDYDVSLEEILKSSPTIPANGVAFIYQFTEKLARVLAQKQKRKYYVIWTELLRKMGISGISDIEGSGTIHIGEIVQGVFFDISKLQTITIIANKPDERNSLRTLPFSDFDTRDRNYLQVSGLMLKLHSMLNPSGYSKSFFISRINLIANLSKNLLDISRQKMSKQTQNKLKSLDIYYVQSRINLMVKAFQDDHPELNDMSKIAPKIKFISEAMSEIRANVQGKTNDPN